MSEYELLDLMTSLQAEGGRAFMDFVTVLFGYLVVAHFIGPNLTRSFVLGLSAAYSLFAIFPAWAVMNVILQSQRLLQVYGEMEVAPWMGSSGLGLSFLPPIAILIGWLISLGYMYRVRRATRS